MYRSTSLLIFFLSSVGLSKSDSVFEKNSCSKIDEYPFALLSSNCYSNPDVLSDVQSTTIRHGYRIESYLTTTPDGYILTIFRVLPKKGKSGKSPVFIQHGLATGSGPWIDIGNRSIAFSLVDLGYDVWLGNFRGSTYSREHVKLSINSKEFWDFSLDELIKYDIPTQLEFVADKTGKGGSIIYIGHSMGTTTAMLFASEYPAQAKKLIKGIFALAPVAYLKGSPLMKIMDSVITMLYYSSPVRGMTYHEPLQNQILVPLCRLIPRICLESMSLFGKSVQFLPDDLPLYFTYWPSGTSLKVMFHYHLIVKHDKLLKFDYGEKKNLEVYGSKESPLYNLGKLTVPLYLFYGKRDTLYTEKNIERLYNEVGSNKKYKTAVPASDDKFAFTHVDFMYAEYLKEYLYADLFRHIEELQTA